MNRGYIRVSTKMQDREGVSLEAQRKRIEHFLSPEPVLFYQDVGSGRSLSRPGLQRLLKDLKSGDRVIIYKLSRLGRSLEDLWNLVEQFRKKKVNFVFCCDSIDTSTANGRLSFRILGAVVEWEREIIAERTLEAMAHCRRRGRYLGGVPFGYERCGKKLIPLKEEQVALRYILELREQGLSFVKIAGKLDKIGVQPKRSNHWFDSSVQGILKRKAKLAEA